MGLMNPPDIFRHGEIAQKIKKELISLSLYFIITIEKKQILLITKTCNNLIMLLFLKFHKRIMIK